jgi:hypothetical protein
MPIPATADDLELMVFELNALSHAIDDASPDALPGSSSAGTPLPTRCPSRPTPSR